ncbi:hypothetical protein PISMIDRAFT_680624 [Pisolithus microcarpus 441]|uniref:Uncharacterized protein n=1 Tax=Pisolithus microcarpus 441 TaxID=765257 RepID=A0A0C9Z7W1_9AGAM|nr:hypothetical protein PISMIDRAFT_680624 [Pisolithus microcarpus 441]
MVCRSRRKIVLPDTPPSTVSLSVVNQVVDQHAVTRKPVIMIEINPDICKLLVLGSRGETEFATYGSTLQWLLANEVGVEMGLANS